MASQINVEYFFARIYDCFHGGCYGSSSGSGLSEVAAFAAAVWFWVNIIGYLLAAAAFFWDMEAAARSPDEAAPGPPAPAPAPAPPPAGQDDRGERLHSASGGGVQRDGIGVG